MRTRRKNAITDSDIARLRGTIMEHTSRVIARGGVTGCTLSAVAKSAGCSVGMIQHHFETRDALVLASIQYRSDTSVQEWTRLAQTEHNPVDRLRSLLLFAVEGEESFTDAWGFWLQAYAAALREERIRIPIVGALHVWRSLFTDTITEVHDSLSGTPDLAPERIASFLLAAVDGYAAQTLGGFYGGTVASMRTDLCTLAESLLGLSAGALTDMALT